MTQSYGQNWQDVNEGALKSLGKVVRSTNESIMTGIQTELDAPLRPHATFPTPDGKINFTSSPTDSADGAKRAIPAMGGVVNTVAASTLDFQSVTHATTGATFVMTWPTSSTLNYYRRVGFSLDDVGQINVIFSTEHATQGALPNPGTVIGAYLLPIGWIDVQCTDITNHLFKSAGAGTSVINNSTITRFGSGGGASVNSEVITYSEEVTGAAKSVFSASYQFTATQRVVVRNNGIQLSEVASSPDPGQFYRTVPNTITQGDALPVNGWFEVDIYGETTLVPPPSGYSVLFTTDPVNNSNKAAVAFAFSSAEVGSTYNYTITSSGGGGSVTGSGTISTGNQSISGINCTSLPDGTLTVSTTLTNGGGAGPAATDTVLKDVVAPSGYSVLFTTDPVNNSNKAAVAFAFTSAVVGTTYNYTITSSGGGGSVTNSGTISTANQTISGINCTSLPDGTLTVSATLTDTSGNVGTAATDTVLKDVVAPSGYSVLFTTDPVNYGNEAAVAFAFTSAVVGTTYNYTITSSGGGGSVTGSGTISTGNQSISGINCTTIPDGTLTASVTLTDAAGNVGATATDTVVKNTILAFTANAVDGSKFDTNVQSVLTDSVGTTFVGGSFTNYAGTSGRSKLVKFSLGGDLDTAFCTNAVDGGKFGVNHVYSLAVQTDGKVLVGGSFTNYAGTAGRNRLIRLNSDGTLDTAFCTNAVDGSQFFGTVEDIKLQSDGKILVGGFFNAYAGTAGRQKLIRLNSDGTLDTAFCTNAVDGSKFDNLVRAVVLQPDGKILVGGSFTNYAGTAGRQKLIRLNSDGTLDTAFCTNAVDGSKFDLDVITIHRQSDGKILVGGDFNAYAGTAGRNRLIRLNSDGTLDTAFCTNAVDGSKFDFGIYDLRTDSSGKIYVGGNFTAYAGTAGRQGLIRLNSSGTLDTAFCTTAVDGYKVSSILSGSIFNDKIVVGGAFSNYAGTSGRSYLVKLNSDGTVN